MLACCGVVAKQVCEVDSISRISQSYTPALQLLLTNFVAAPNCEEPKISVLASDTVACHRKRSFNVAFKQKVIQFAEYNSEAAVARAFNIDQKCVQTRYALNKRSKL